MKKKIDEIIYDNAFLSLNEWLSIHYPKIMCEYQNIKENLITE